MTSRQVGATIQKQIVQFLQRFPLSHVLVSLETHASSDGGLTVVQQSPQNEEIHQLLPDVRHCSFHIHEICSLFLTLASLRTSGHRCFEVNSKFGRRPTTTEAFTPAHMWWSCQ